MDVSANGTVYVADRGADEIKVWDQAGTAHAFRVAAPLSLAALPDGEVAVATQNGARLITVFGANGKVAREMGNPEELSTRADLNRYLSLGRLASDTQGRIYYGYTYLPEPLVRQYDRFGFAAGVDFEFTGLDAMSEARATRREIDRQDKQQDKHQEPPRFPAILTAFGVDPESGEVWMCLHNTLLHFDKDGNRRSEYQIFTPDGSRLDGTVLLVEEEVLLIGSDPLGRVRVSTSGQKTLKDRLSFPQPHLHQIRANVHPLANFRQKRRVIREKFLHLHNSCACGKVVHGM